jgi:hypothetical protein
MEWFRFRKVMNTFDLMRRIELPEYLAIQGNHGGSCLHRTEGDLRGHFYVVSTGGKRRRELGVIVHIAVASIMLANCHGGLSPESVPHMPFARKALDDSVTKKAASNRPLPNARKGYEAWKEAYSKKESWDL